MIVDETWQPLIAGTVKKAACIMCGVESSWHPKNWWFRYVSMSGGRKNDPKVTTERLCPGCAKDKLGLADA